MEMPIVSQLIRRWTASREPRMTDTQHARHYLDKIAEAASLISADVVEEMASLLASTRAAGGRLFILGVGGSAGNAGHAVNDFRKLCGIESYAPTDNVSELTARTNDEGWSTVFSEWLKVSNACPKDAILVLSVGGGNAERGISMNLVSAIDLAKENGLKVFGVVGRSDGHTAKNADLSVIVPSLNDNWQTPISEAFQSIVWHCLVSHPLLQKQDTTW